jgi:hypothetical protein
LPLAIQKRMMERERTGEMTKKEATKPTNPTTLFELILRGSGLFTDSSDWRDLKYAHHVDWLKPLLESGAIEHDGSEPAWLDTEHKTRRPFSYHKYRTTEKGIPWWATERVRQAEEREPIDIAILTRPHGDSDPVIDGKGIGSTMRFWWWPHAAAALKGIRDGYFKLEYYDWGHPSMKMYDDITVSLTRKGMEYFDSIPRLVLECA